MAMPVLRRKTKRLLLVILIACLFWLMYLLSSLPSKGEMMSFPGKDINGLPGDFLDKSISRKHFTTPYKLVHKIENVKNVLEPPNPEPAKDSAAQKKAAENDTASQKQTTTKNKPGNLDIRALGGMIKNKTFELGVKLKNKTVEVGARMKNKTLEQLAVMGVHVAAKPLPQLIDVPSKWTLNVSFDDIGAIMKETQFLNKVDPLNMDGPILLSSRNRTANFTYAMPLKFGFCDCFERYCICCTQITNKKLHLNTTACSNFTFVSKTHELDLQFSLDGKPIYQSIFSADKSPLLCLGSIPRVAHICVHLFNMTFKVNEHFDHQTQLLGCTDLSLNLYNMTIGAFPVDCFQIPGDPSKTHKDRKSNMMFNWVP